MKFILCSLIAIFLLTKSYDALSDEVVEFSELTTLRETLASKTSESFNIEYSSFNWNGMRLISHQNAIYQQVTSWILLGDASTGNPFYSERLERITEESPLCFRRILLEAVERELQKIGNVQEQEAVMNSIFGKFEPLPFEFDINNLGNAPELGRTSLKFSLENWGSHSGEYLLFMLGTKSYLPSRAGFPIEGDPGHMMRMGMLRPGTGGSVGLTRHVRNSYHFIKTLWEQRGSEASNALLEEAMSCEMKGLDLVDLFPWFDREGVYRLIEDRASSIDELKEKIEEMAETSWRPTYPTRNDHFDYTIIPPRALAMRPVLGLLLTEADISPKFVTAYLELITEKAFTRRNYLKFETCQEMSKIASWGNALGFSVPLYNKEAFGVTEEIYKETARALVAIPAMRGASNPDHFYECMTTFGNIMRMWNFSWAMFGNIETLARVRFEGRLVPFSSRKYAAFGDVDTGWLFKSGVYKIEDGKYVKRPNIVDVSSKSVPRNVRHLVEEMEHWMKMTEINRVIRGE
jgi:hypothetical protein